MVSGGTKSVTMVGYPCVRVCLPVSYRIYNGCRPWGIAPGWWRCNSRPVNIDGGIIDNRGARRIIVDMIHLYRRTRILPDLGRARPADIGYIVIDIGIADNHGLVYYVHHPFAGYVVIIDEGAANIGLRCAYPVIFGNVVVVAQGYV